MYKKKFDQIAEYLPYGIIITNEESKMIYCNSSINSITGFSKRALIGKYLNAVIKDNLTDSKKTEETARRIAKRLPYSYETITHKRNGAPIWVRFDGQPLVEEGTNKMGWLLTMTDISLQKEGELEILLTRNKYKSIFSNSPLPNIIYDSNSLEPIEMNQAAAFTYGYKVGDAGFLSILDLIPEKDHITFHENSKKASDGEICHQSCIHLRKKQDPFYAEVTSCSIAYKNHSAVLLIVKDVTEKRKLEKQLMDEILKRERRVLEAKLYGQELERVEIGRELHDNVNQMLSTVKLYQEIALADQIKSSEYIQKGSEILLDAINEIRSMSRSLVAHQLKDFKLRESIVDLLKTVQQGSSVKIKYQDNCAETNFQYKAKLTIYRIIQEQLNNIIKHAEATMAWINIKTDESHIHVMIRDNGKGIQLNKQNPGIGLQNIKSRAEYYEGTMKISSKPLAGCRLQITIPCATLCKEDILI